MDIKCKITEQMFPSNNDTNNNHHWWSSYKNGIMGTLIFTEHLPGGRHCAVYFIGWVKGLFMFFHNILQKDLNELFGYPNTYINLVNNNKTYLMVISTLQMGKPSLKMVKNLPMSFC